MGQESLYGAVAGVPVDVEVAGGELVITVWRYDPAAVGQFTIDARSGTAAVVAAVAGEDGGTGRPAALTLRPLPGPACRPRAGRRRAAMNAFQDGPRAPGR